MSAVFAMAYLLLCTILLVNGSGNNPKQNNNVSCLRVRLMVMGLQLTAADGPLKLEPAQNGSVRVKWHANADNGDHSQEVAPDPMLRERMVDSLTAWYYTDNPGTLADVAPVCPMNTLIGLMLILAALPMTLGCCVAVIRSHPPLPRV